MKNKIKEINKLPYIFNYLEFNEYKKSTEGVIHFAPCSKFKTDFMELCKPDKNLVRYI